MGAPLVAGVELGGTKCVCLLASGPSDIREEVRIATGAPQQTLAQIQAVLSSWQRGPGFAALGLASFGPLDPGAKFDEEGTGWGWKSIGVVKGADTMLPTTCKMDHPS